MTTNPILKSAYFIQLEENDENNGFKLHRISKTGNSEPWNAVFSAPDLCTVKMIGPLEAAEDRIIYSIELNKHSHKDKRTIVLQTSSFLYPIGIGHEASDKNSYLFRITGDNVFEVFVADITGIDDGILIQMFMDGSLADEICDLQERSA